MSTEPTAEDHIREARRYAARAEQQADATSYTGTMARTNDLQAAQVHATLAQTLKAAELMPLMARLVARIAPAQSEAPASGDGQEEDR